MGVVYQLTLDDSLDAKVEDVFLLCVRVEYSVKGEACLVSSEVGRRTAHHLSLVRLEIVSNHDNTLDIPSVAAFFMNAVRWSSEMLMHFSLFASISIRFIGRNLHVSTTHGA